MIPLFWYCCWVSSCPCPLLRAGAKNDSSPAPMEGIQTSEIHEGSKTPQFARYGREREREEVRGVMQQQQQQERTEKKTLASKSNRRHNNFRGYVATPPSSYLRVVVGYIAGYAWLEIAFDIAVSDMFFVRGYPACCLLYCWCSCFLAPVVLTPGNLEICLRRKTVCPTRASNFWSQETVRDRLQYRRRLLLLCLLIYLIEVGSNIIVGGGPFSRRLDYAGFRC